MIVFSGYLHVCFCPQFVAPANSIMYPLALKVPCKIVADDILKYFIFFSSFREKTTFHVNSLPSI